MFTAPVDIANRALQHCGASRIAALTDNDKGAGEISQCYDGLRRAELRRNVWRFAIRRATLYPINTALTSLPYGAATPSPIAPADVATSLPTLLLVPSLWSATRVYAFGSIVQDSAGNIWVSTLTANVGNQPSIDANTAWDSYFGSMNVQPYDTTGDTAYNIGDLVYEDNGQGAINVFVSLESGNSGDPSTPTPYLATQAYDQGDVVVDAAGYFWQSTCDLNTGNQPGVYGFWSATPTYVLGALVIGSDNVLYQALTASNHNLNPAAGAHPSNWLKIGYPGSWPIWNTNTTYAAATIAAGTDGMLYQSLQASNTGNQPVGSTYNPNTPATNWWMGLRLQNPWTSAFATGTYAGSWLRLDAGVQTININYPIGAGPAIQTFTRNVFQLPNGFLRMAPEDPKAGSVSFMGAPTGLMYKDWNLEGNYLTSQQPFPIVLRFVADVTQVPKMDDMFCEGLGARIAAEVCETLTQSGNKLGTIASAYARFMGEARTINGIETGAVEPPEDDFITCRI